MTNKSFKFFDGIFSSPVGNSNGTRDLLDKLGTVIHADLQCLNESDRKEILNQVGIPLDTFIQGFQVKSLSNLWSIELLIISKLKCADLVARLWAARQKFQSQVGEDVYRKYVSSLANELTEEKIKLLITPTAATDQQSTSPTFDDVKLEAAIRSDFINLTRQTQRLSYYKLLRLDSIYKVKRTILSALLSILVLMTIMMYLSYSLDFPNVDLKPQHFSLAVLTIFSGMIGSCMSLLQRTEKASGAPSSFTDSVLDAIDIKLSMTTPYVYSLIFSGAIFATILYLLAVSGTFKYLGALENLLPQLDMQPDSAVCSEQGVRALFSCVKYGAKNALMLVWGFMAGFAERLVPDTLDLLMEKAKKAKV